MNDTEAMAEPEWLEGLDDRAKLTAIMAALRRCYAECGGHGHSPDSPHITTTMAELFIGQMMTAAGAELAQIRADLAAALGFASFRNAPLAPVQRLLAAARTEVYGEDS